MDEEIETDDLSCQKSGKEIFDSADRSSLNAKQYLLRILSKRSYLSAECRLKLQRKGFPSTVIEKVIGECQEKGYLDDALYLERLVAKEQKQGRSYRALKQKWMQKSGGDGALFANEGSNREEFEREALQNYLAKKKSQEALCDPKEKQKLIQRLLQRGFSWENIEREFRERSR